MLLAILGILFAPSLYVLIYVSSVWDPYGKLSQLPVALVNTDAAIVRAGRTIDLGSSVTATLEKQKPFGFVRYPSAEKARDAVYRGDVFFALVIPPDFSAKAVGGEIPATFEVVVAEGANYTASILGRRFGTELAHTVNETLARERWALLLGDPSALTQPNLRDGLTALAAGARQVADGAVRVHAGSSELNAGLERAQAGGQRLAEGLPTFAEGATRLSAGMRQVGNAVGSIRGSLPDDAKLDQLAEGSRALTQGAGALKEGLDQLVAAAPKLEAGAGELQAGAAKVPLAGGRLSAGTGRLREGIVAFSAGVARADEGSTKISDGLTRLDAAVQPLSAGLVRLNAGLNTLAEKLPPSAQLDRFDQALGQLRDGSRELSAGLDRLAVGAGKLATGSSALADGAERLASGLSEANDRFEEGFGAATPRLLAAPVEAVIDATQVPAASNGQAFAPYFSALSIWVGAVMMSFVFYLRRLPEIQRSASRPAKWCAKVSPLLLLGLVQATVVVGAMKWLLHIPFAHPGQVWLIAVLGSVTFVSVVFCLLSLLGDAGRLLAIVLLILQLAASGGIYPVELAHGFYQQVHEWLPLTFLVRGFRATMFDAFAGHWLPSVVALATVATGAILLSLLFARWKYVPDRDYGPAVEF